MVRSTLAGISVGSGYPARIMGVINVSPESFFKGSVYHRKDSLLRAIEQMEGEGADFIDVGAMSSAPYLKTQISEEEEARRLAWAINLIQKNCRLPVSVDSYRAFPAEAGLNAGGKILNDITGLQGNPKIASVAKQAKGLILMAHPKAFTPFKKSPIDVVTMILHRSLSIATSNGIPRSRIVIDPGIGFFRNASIAWWEWDLDVLRNLEKLSMFKVPVLVGVSRKSFIGEILQQKNPSDRLAGSLAATAVAVLKGASLIRTHDVKATKEVVKTVEAIKSQIPSTKS